jgi:DNA-directed RNA polymerase sigma subunit (sigma70/sigma32)
MSRPQLTPLQRSQDSYHRAVATADEARNVFRAAIRAALDDGRTLADIGEELGLSRERVRQIATAR